MPTCTQLAFLRGARYSVVLEFFQQKQASVRAVTI